MTRHPRQVQGTDSQPLVSKCCFRLPAIGQQVVPVKLSIQQHIWHVSSRHDKVIFLTVYTI